MNTIPPKHELAKKLSDAYEALLANFQHHIIDEVRDDIAALNTFSKDEAVLLKEYVKRDLADAAHYLDSTGKELKDWLGFDLELIESGLWRKFSAAADKTALELLQIRQQAESIGYSTGELTGIGTLLCDQCATPLHFHKPGHIPPCPKCHHTHFHRQAF